MTSDAPFVFRLEPGASLDPGFTEIALAEFERPEVAAVAGTRRARRPRTTIFDRIADMEARVRPGRVDALPPNAMIRRGAAGIYLVVEAPMVTVDERSRGIRDWFRDGFEAGRRGGRGALSRGAAVVALPAAAVAASLALLSSWPLVALPAVAAFLAYETGSRESWRAGDVESRFLFGAHRWLESLPAAAGRLSRLSGGAPTPPADTPSRS